MSASPTSPEQVDVVLRDGSTVRIRPVRAQDHAAVVDFLRGLSERSRWLRFFSGSQNLQRSARWATDVDYRDRYGLIAVAGEDIVGHGGYERTDGDRAEIAFTIADAYQGRGLGTILLGKLAQAAHANGVNVFAAEVMASNHRMVQVLRDSGFRLTTRAHPGALTVEFPTSISPDAAARFELREQIAAVAAVRGFLAARSVAVIGASRRRGTIGGEIFRNLVTTGFNGPVFPVNPLADVVQSVPAYRSIADVPGSVELAVIAIPADGVVEAARACARKGVRSLVVVSAGFSEIGEAGRERQRAVVDVCRGAGMRLIGPNCMGIINTSPDVMLAATFAPVWPPHGRVGFLSQSGALGLAVIDYARELGLGLSSFVSVGNKADVSGNDLIQYWESDAATELILLYLESFGNPRKFARIARRVGRAKPIVAVKSGRTAAGARATGSHTGALLAASDVTVDALFRQAGVIRTDTLSELFDVATLLSNQPPPAGKRVAILTNAGGPGILCADACEASGLEVRELPYGVKEQLAEFLPAEASLANPVDMIAGAGAEDYRRAIAVLASCEEVDAVIVIFIPPLVTLAREVAGAIRDAARSLPRAIPLMTVFMSARGVPEELRGDDVGVPSYAFPEDAARALGRAASYGVWRTQDEGRIPQFEECLRDEAASIVATGLSDEAQWLGPGEVARLLECYGLPLAEYRLAGDAAAAAHAAGELGGPVALKVIAPALVHKTDAGGVRLDLSGSREVERAARQMEDSLRRAGHDVEGFLVQRMVPGGVEMLVGVVHDESFGPVLACGAGGVAVELLKDVQVRITPINDKDAREMVSSLATFPLLRGYRGAAPADVAALEEVLLRVSAMVEEHPEIVEMDVNPLKVMERGAVVVDARVRIADDRSAERANPS